MVLAGQVGIDPSTGRLVEGDAAQQAAQVLANVSAVLTDCGATFADVAKANVYLSDLADLAAVNDVYAAVFAGHRPARTTVGVAALPLGAAVEIEVWAYVGEAS